MLLDEIEMLVVISESRSLSQAAERLHMSRSSLSQKIHRLESEYKTTLFERTSQGVTPTRAGQIVTRFAEQTLSARRELTAELAALGESFIADIIVGTSFADGVALLPGIVKKFHDERPDVKIHLEVGYEPEILRKMSNFAIDFSVLEDKEILSGFTWDCLGQKRLVCLAPNMHPFNRLSQPVKYEVVLPLPMIIYEWESGRHMVGDRHFREHHGIGLNRHNVVARMDTHEAMLEGVRSGLGWGMFPEAIADRCKDDPDIMKVDIHTPDIYYDVSVVTFDNKPLSALSREFLNFMKSNIPKGYFRK